MSKLPEHSVVFGTVDELSEYIYNTHMAKCNYSPALQKFELLRSTKNGIRNQIEYIARNNFPAKINGLHGPLVRSITYGSVVYYVINGEGEVSVAAQYIGITDESIPNYD